MCTLNTLTWPNLNDSTTFLLPNISLFFTKIISLHPNVVNCQNTLTVLTNGSDVYERCGHNARQCHPSCTACRRTANLTGPAWQVYMHAWFNLGSQCFGIKHISQTITRSTDVRTDGSYTQLAIKSMYNEVIKV